MPKTLARVASLRKLQGPDSPLTLVPQKTLWAPGEMPWPCLCVSLCFLKRATQWPHSPLMSAERSPTARSSRTRSTPRPRREAAAPSPGEEEPLLGEVPLQPD